MIDLTYRQLAEAMEQQVQQGKKDQYIAITEAITEIDLSKAEPAEKLDYLENVYRILKVMDFQIYELYRKILDLFKTELESMLRDCWSLINEKKTNELVLTQDEAEWVKKTEELFEKACEARYMVKEQADFWNPEGLQEETVSKFAIEPNLEVRLLQKNARCATLELVGAGQYETRTSYTLYVNGRKKLRVTTTVLTVFDLMPDTEYVLDLISEEQKQHGTLKLKTDPETVTLNVRDFGAKGDGESNDTAFLQAAVLTCPAGGRVLVPEGVYRFTSLFLKSEVHLELSEGACLKAIPDRSLYTVQPFAVPSTDGKSEYHFGTWEGNPLPMFTGVLMGYEVKNASVYGKGILDGSASAENWWHEPKKLNIAYRPKLVFLNRCDHVKLIGITLMNSPCWTMHPFFSTNLGFYNLTVKNPPISPNTDGCDPESCSNVEIAGIRFSLGDDCIAVKAGKIYMGKKYKTPCENIRIHHCLMEQGHGAVTLGSEISGGIRNLSVEDCTFSHTDRGLRIKSRRGRGQDAVLDQIAFRRIQMDQVMTPFVCNSFYFCDPDGKTEYVQSRQAYPVDERTPVIRKLEFEDIDARDCHVAAAFLEGLPEQKIEEIVFRNVRIGFAQDCRTDVPAMTDGIEACSKRGIIARNVQKLVIEGVEITGYEGEKYDLSDIDTLMMDEKDRKE